MIFRAFAASAILTSLLTTFAFAENKDFSLLVGKAPSDSNVLTLVNADLIRSSDFYKSAAASEGDIPFPGLESVKQFVAASRWRLPEGSAIFETMIVYLDGVSASDVIANDQASESSKFPEGTIPVKLSADTLGLYYPNDRQAAMRWADSGEINFQSDYLSKGIGYAENNDTQIVFAVDLDNALDPASMRSWIESNPFPGSTQLNPQSAANIIASLDGCTMGIKCTDKAVASWRFDFGANVKTLELVAKPLILNLIDRLGLSLTSMQTWEARVNDKSLFITGELSPSDIRVLMSVLAKSPESLDQLQLSKESAGSPNSSLTKVESTKMHYDMLNKILRDITHPTNSILTSGAKANYLERYASKIDGLPILNVDEDLLGTSAEIAMRLRTQSEGLRGNQIKAGNYSNNSREYSYNGGSYGLRYGLSDQQVAKHLGRASSALSGVEQKKQIANLMADLRRTLTQRYQVEF
ncbi:hypothetical protein Poly51_13630 [Rubripirellula tenax]|uniref:Uncharacterized protein n=1 Tax=Rubripirellula tenax TaxID=2528015 RepID=A0A5C6FEG4_9BACT|nr:hypothetical protein [Rubripirellula tenax]TWU58584.1 hypothetical protein Poly51_13630 [Rubripirellula tenax]